MSRYENNEYRDHHARYSRDWNKKNPDSVRQRHARWKLRNPEKYRAIQANSSLKRRYGITLEQRDQMLLAQGNKCAICQRTDSGRKNFDWIVDHCHRTDRVRGILCHPCNSVLGYAGDNIETLTAAIDYLHRISWGDPQ